jgi:hypothetical protein
MNLAERERCRTCERLLDGTVDEFRNSSTARPAPQCLRCREPLQLLGERVLEDLHLEVHVCVECRHVELLAPGLRKSAPARSLPIPATPGEAEASTLPLPHEPREDG